MIGINKEIVILQKFTELSGPGAGDQQTRIADTKPAKSAVHRHRRILENMLRAGDRERRLIAYEIHDGLTQQLAAAIMQLETFAHRRDAHPQQAEAAFQVALAMLRQSHFEARRLIARIRPPILDEAGVVEAIAHLGHELRRHNGPRIEFRKCVDFVRLSPALEDAVYRIAQEGLTNACRHSRSNKVRISLSQCADRLRLEIRDWGMGFEPKNAREKGIGLKDICQRTKVLGGRCAVRTEAGKGTRIRVELPIVPPEA